MSRAPNHLQRIAVQQGMSKLKKLNYSNAIPTDYQLARKAPAFRPGMDSAESAGLLFCR